MAELAKKLHFLKNGTEQTTKAYSTTAEAGSSYITNVIDGVTCYIPIGSTSDAQATMGRVLKGGTTYAIKSQAKPAYTEKSWTTAGTYTFTVPAGVTRIRVAVCGGGGGSTALMHTGMKDANYTAGRGGTSKFGSLLEATGGYGGYVKQTSWETEDSGGTEHSGKGGSGGAPNGNSGNYLGQDGRKVTLTSSGGTGFSLSFNKIDGSYGNGAYAKITSKYSWVGVATAGGGSGGYNSGYVNVTPGTTYTISVGAGGTNITNDVFETTEASRTYYNSKPGFVHIAYGGDI